jgi:hypothetical protein
MHSPCTRLAGVVHLDLPVASRDRNRPLDEASATASTPLDLRIPWDQLLENCSAADLGPIEQDVVLKDRQHLFGEQQLD